MYFFVLFGMEVLLLLNSILLITNTNFY